MEQFRPECQGPNPPSYCFRVTSQSGSDFVIALVSSCSAVGLVLLLISAFFCYALAYLKLSCCEALGFAVGQAAHIVMRKEGLSPHQNRLRLLSDRGGAIPIGSFSGESITV